MIKNIFFFLESVGLGTNTILEILIRLVIKPLQATI